MFFAGRAWEVDRSCSIFPETDTVTILLSVLCIVAFPPNCHYLGGWGGVGGGATVRHQVLKIKSRDDQGDYTK